MICNVHRVMQLMKHQASFLSHALLKCSLARPESCFDNVSPGEHSYEPPCFIYYWQASDLLLQQDASSCLYIGFRSDHQRVGCHDIRNPARSNNHMPLTERLMVDSEAVQVMTRLGTVRCRASLDSMQCIKGRCRCRQSSLKSLHMRQYQTTDQMSALLTAVHTAQMSASIKVVARFSKQTQKA